MTFTRLLDKDTIPTEAAILAHLGEARAAWVDLQAYLGAAYPGFPPELIFGGKNYGWTVRYRRNGKTLCGLYPEAGAFTALIVLGKAEVEKAQAAIAELNPTVRAVFENTPQLHDGRWLGIRVRTAEDAASVKVLLRAKRRPEKTG